LDGKVRFCTEVGCIRPEDQDLLEGPCDQQKGVGGPCEAEIPAWTFDKVTKICEIFSYGGCGGNENKFGSKSECEKTCVSSSGLDGDGGSGQDYSEGPCDQQKGVIGPCEADIPAWTFDKVTKICEKFSYGGCEGNENNFRSKSECEKTCVSSSGQDGDGEPGQDYSGGYGGHGGSHGGYDGYGRSRRNKKRS